MSDLSGLKDLLSVPRQIVITTHHKPDADALGSSLALYNYLKKKGHKVQVVTPTDYPKFLNWMEGEKQVWDFENTPREKVETLVNNAEVIFCLDFSSISRINAFGPMVTGSKAKIVLIDHHTQPEDFAHLRFWNTAAAATCELIFELIRDLGDFDLIDVAIGECLYAGIMTDTGSFRHPSTTKNVHHIIAELIGIGVNASKIHKLVYDSSTETRLRFLGHILTEKLVVLPDYKTAFITINKEELKHFKAQTGDTEGFVNYALSIDGIKLAAIIVDRTEMVKLSFRSVGPFSVSSFAREHFEGGGHENAAGGKSELTLEETVEKFIGLLPLYKELLVQESVI